MKKDLKLTKLMLFALTGALITASLVYSEESAAGRQSEQQSQQSQSYQSESQSLDIKSDDQALGVEISDPAGAERSSAQFRSQAASFGSLERASDLIGMEVQSQQGEKLGDIKDVMVDLQSGRIPFAVLSSGGILGVGDRLLAIPPTALDSQGDALVLSVDQNQLKNAPTFGRNEWPQTMDRQWSANVYQFYGQQPYWQTSGTITEPSGVEIHETQGPVYYEPSGASSSGASVTTTTTATAPVYYEKQHVTRYGKTFVGDNNTLDDINRGSGTRGGAEDLQDFDEKANAWKDTVSEYHAAHRGVYQSHGTAYGPGYEAGIVEPSAASRGEWQGSQATTTRHYTTSQPSTQTTRSSTFRGGALNRASDLIGLNVKDSQGQTIGEIKDVVIDVDSGHVAFIAFEGSGSLDVEDQWIAVPPSAFRSMGGTDKEVTLNIGADRLRNAPTFEEGSWEQATGEEFVSRVYRHYGQQPYWRSTGKTFKEPSGTEPQPSEELNQQEQQFKQEGTETDVESRQLEEPSGAEQPESQELNLEEKDSQAPERELSDPAGSEIESSSESTQIEQEEKSSAQLEQQETAAPSAGVDVSSEQSSETAEAQSGAAINEQAGAEQVSESAGAATSADQTGAAKLVENVRMELQRDTSSQNIQVTTEQGKIVLKGTVTSEADKQRIEEKVQGLLIDNQLQVKGGAGTSPSQP
jgi:sporulation protein YlmC with PRC-barrel domain/osmotically-inducible protein OsmY